MIIYVNVDKNTGKIIVNNDLFPNTDIIQCNSGTINNLDNNITFELAFNTTFFENQSPIMGNGNINANTN